jgi:hypothetical protein
MTFSEEMQWFIANQDELVLRYKGKHIALLGKEVVGVYDSHPTAYTDIEMRGLLGRAMIQECIAGEEAYTVECPSIELLDAPQIGEPNIVKSALG